MLSQETIDNQLKHQYISFSLRCALELKVLKPVNAVVAVQGWKGDFGHTNTHILTGMLLIPLSDLFDSCPKALAVQLNPRLLTHHRTIHGNTRPMVNSDLRVFSDSSFVTVSLHPSSISRQLSKKLSMASLRNAMMSIMTTESSGSVATVILTMLLCNFRSGLRSQLVASPQLQGLQMWSV